MSGGRLEDQGGWLRVVNDNPGRRNALCPEYYALLHSALEQATASPRIGAVVLTGAGGYFCAGGDLAVLARRHELPEEDRRARITLLQDLIRAVLACPRPVIAAIEGGAAGAGLSLAMACDLIVAAEDARFSAAYVKAGLVPDGGLTASLTRTLPAPVVAEMCLTGAPVSAARLHQLGAVNRLCPPGTALSTAEELAAALAAGPAGAQAAIKRLLTGAQAALYEAQLAAETEAMAQALAGPEAAEGIGAFLDRRAPDFAALRRKPEES